MLLAHIALSATLVGAILGSAVAATAAASTAKPASARQQPAADFYVAPDGRDTWSGRLPQPNKGKTDGPFATLEKARNALLGLKARKGPRVVLVRGGTYFLPQTFVLRPEDSGTEASPVVFAAYPGEKPVISGGRRVTGWKAEGETWSTHLPDVEAGRWYFRQLFVGGKRRLRPRLPREGYYPTPGGAEPQWDNPRNFGAFRYREGDIRADWANIPDLEVVFLQYWMAAHLRIASIEDATRTVNCTGKSWRTLLWSRGYHVENVREALESPGQWYLDRKSGVLTYRPLPGEDPARVEVIAPRLEELVRFEGSVAEGKRVEHVLFRGLTFMHSAWVLPEEGFAHPQADLPLPAAIRAENAQHCAFEGCEVRHTGAWAIELGSGCKDNRITGCRLHDIGAGGIKVGHPKDPGSDAAEACRTLIADNTLSEGAVLSLGSPAIWIAQSSGNRICHNEVFGPWQWAVSLGWSWHYMPPNRTRDNLVEWNHFHHIGTGVLGSHSVIYALGISPGTVIRNNLVHHSGGYGIGLDQSASGVLVENNVTHHMQQGGIHFNWDCLGNIVQNNVFALGTQSQLTRYGDAPPGDDTNSNIFQRNILYWKEGKLYNEEKWPNYRMVIDYNLYFDASGRPVTFLTFPFEEWRKRGLDHHSVIADPLFKDPEAGDFTLPPDSPALALGFRPIDLSGVGPREEKSRK